MTKNRALIYPVTAGRQADTARAALEASAGSGTTAGSGTLARQGVALAEVFVELWVTQGERDSARRHLERVVTLPPDLTATEARANVLNGLGLLAVQTQDFEDAFWLLGQALAVVSHCQSERIGSEWDREFTTHWLFCTTSGLIPL